MYEQMQLHFNLKKDFPYAEKRLMQLCDFLGGEIDKIESESVKYIPGTDVERDDEEKLKCIYSYIESITELNRMDEEISRIPRGIGMLKALNKLWLYFNRIKRLPKEIGT